MSNKRLVGLVPILAALAALAAMPVAAQSAIPHWYKSGKRIAEGSKVPYLLYGGAVDVAQENQAGGLMKCMIGASGYVENPRGSGLNIGMNGPAGVGETLSIKYYSCIEPQCETEVMELLGTGYVGHAFAVGYNEPWANQLQGVGPTTFEDKIGGQPNAGVNPPGESSWGEGYAEGFPARTQAPNGLGTSWGATNAVGEITGCEAYPNPEGAPGFGLGPGQPERVKPSGDVQWGELPFEGELHPEIGGGCGSPAIPEEMTFTGAPSEYLEGTFPFKDTYSGELKILGYETQSALCVLPN